MSTFVLSLSENVFRQFPFPFKTDALLSPSFCLIVFSSCSWWSFWCLNDFTSVLLFSSSYSFAGDVPFRGGASEGPGAADRHIIAGDSDCWTTASGVSAGLLSEKQHWKKEGWLLFERRWTSSDDFWLFPHKLWDSVIDILINLPYFESFHSGQAYSSSFIKGPMQFSPLCHISQAEKTKLWWQL